MKIIFTNQVKYIEFIWEQGGIPALRFVFSSDFDYGIVEVPVTSDEQVWDILEEFDHLPQVQIGALPSFDESRIASQLDLTPYRVKKFLSLIPHYDSDTRRHVINILERRAEKRLKELEGARLSEDSKTRFQKNMEEIIQLLEEEKGKLSV